MDNAERILFVDDDIRMRSAFRRAVDRSGFEVDEAKDAWAALNLAKQNCYSIVVTDFCMPGLNGLELVDLVRPELPDATFVLVSGVCDLDLALSAVNEHEVSYVIKKPWEPDELLSSLRRASEKACERATQRKLAASIVESTRRLEEREAKFKAAVEPASECVADALLGTLEARDRATQAACRRVAAYAEALARELGLKGREVESIKRGALLHDIGKIGIPDSILLKPTNLTDEEWKVMKTHPEIGARLLAGIDGMEAERGIVIQHHERWDGGGYPGGQKGEEICIGARILAVVDTLDAILSDRPYRKGAPFTVARDEIVRCGGSQFDPSVVVAFLRVDQSTWERLKEEHPDESPSIAA